MEFAKIAFTNFMERMSELFACPCYSNEDLIHVSSYFWEKIIPEIKNIHRSEARVINDAQKHSGKKKVYAFWLFAVELEKAFIVNDHEFYEALWFHFKPEWKHYWQRKMCDAIDCEIERVVA